MATEDVVTKNSVRCTYYSLDEFADAAERRVKMGPGIHRGIGPNVDAWRGGSMEDGYRMARTGWEDDLTETLEIVESAVEMAVREHEIEAFVPVYDVSGCEVDVARYLAGTPENMIDYPLQATSKVGRVITLCAGVSMSSSIKPATAIRRGQVIAAFAMALTRLGHSVEMWADHTASRNGKSETIRVLVKGTNDTLDPSRILFAYASPLMCRALCFSVMNGLPAEFREAIGISANGGYGRPCPPVEDLPEGTIYLPELCSGYDVPDAHTQLAEMLREVGLLKED